MKKFEYKRLGGQYGGGPVRMMDLDQLGEDGWELINIIIKNIHSIYYFKREKK